MTTVLEIRDVSVRFGGLYALNKLSMAVKQGEIHALIGPNGAGKSTVFNCLSRFYSPIEGSIEYVGRNLLELHPHQIPGVGIGRTFQNIEVCGHLTVLENVLIGMSSTIGRYFAFGPSAKRTAAERTAVRDAEGLLERLDLLAFKNAEAASLDFGRLKMLDLARALAAKPSLLLLDEPAAGLRNRELGALNDLLVTLSKKHGMTIVLVEHVMQLVMAAADSLTVLSFGNKICEGDPAYVRNHPDVIEAYLGQGAYA